LPWYWKNLNGAFAQFQFAGSPDTAQHYGTGDILSLPAILSCLGNIGVAAPELYVLLFIVLIVAGLRALDAVGKRGLALCASWTAPIVFLTFSHFRDVRYAAPLLPALAIANGILLAPWLRRPAVRAVAVVVLALPLVSMMQASFRTLGNWQITMGGLLLEPARFSYVRPYNTAEWPQSWILADILRVAEIRPGEARQLLIATDSSSFNTDNFILAAAVKRAPFEIVTSAFGNDRREELGRASNAAYVIYEEGVPLESPYNPFGPDIIHELHTNGRFSELPFAHRTPDGGIARVFANLRNDQNGGFFAAGLSSADRALRVPPCNVSFGDRIRLTGLNLQRTAAGLQADFRWVCVKPLHARFMCFVHVFGDGDKFTGRDHFILNGDPPINTWPAGAAAFETIQIPYADCPPGKNWKLVFGLYRPDTGERLPIFASTLPLTDDQSAVLAAAP